MRYYFALVLLLLAGCNIRSAQDHVLIASDLVENLQMDSALYHLDIALAKDPDHLSAHLLRGWIALKKQYFVGALASFEAVLLRDPANISGYYYRSGTWYEMEEYPKALDDMHMAMALRTPSGKKGGHGFVLEPVANPYLGLEVPEFHVAYDDLAYQYAIIYFHLDSADQALKWLNHCVSRGHQLNDALFVRGLLFHRYGMISEACTDLEEAAIMRHKKALRQWRLLCTGGMAK